MKKLELQIIKGIIVNVTKMNNGRIYELETPSCSLELPTISCDKTSKFIMTEYGIIKSYVCNRPIWIARDDQRLLAIRTMSGSKLFIRDEVLPKCIGYIIDGNKDYIMDRYGLTEEDILRETSKKLTKRTLVS